MNIHQKKRILFSLLIVLIFAASIFGSIFSKEIAISIVAPLLVIYFILLNKWWRCPKCNKSLGRLEHGVTHCKYCGHKLTDD